MASATPFLNRHPELVLSAFRLFDYDLDALAAGRPMINAWFIDNGYRFDFGIAGEAYLILNDVPVQIAETRTDTPAVLFRRELERLIEVRESVNA